MPFNTRRSSTRGTPRALFGNIGLMVIHSSSESLWRTIPASGFGGLNRVTVANLSIESVAVRMSAFGGKPEIFRSIRACITGHDPKRSFTVVGQ
jgi:hypothetical protein